jgi:hypothetical protein
MENIDTPIELNTVVESITEETPKGIEEEDTLSKKTEEEPVSESVEKKDEEIIPVPPTTTTTTEETTKPIDEQENDTDTTPTVTPTCLSPGRVNVPLKEVNESETAIVTNGTENTISKKRELDQEDEQPEEKTNDNDERSGDQTKKIKISEPIDMPIMETKESENNHIVNGISAVEA